MAVGCVQRHAIDTPELLDFLQGPRGERGLAFEGMEHDSLKQVTQTHILQLSHRFQHLKQPLFQANARLNAVDFDKFFQFCRYQYTIIPMYQTVDKLIRETHQ